MKLVQNGRSAPTPFVSYLSEIDDTPLLTASEEHDLTRRVAAGDLEARDHLVRANLRLAVCIARHFAGRGLALEDLVAEGNLGLLRAAEGFDPDAGTRFSTYAAHWVRQSIRRGLTTHGRTVRLPGYVWALVWKWRAAEAALTAESGRVPQASEVAAHLGLSRRKAGLVRRALEFQPAGQETDGDGCRPALAETADHRGEAPDDRLDGEEQVQLALESFGRLGEREASVLRLRFGLDGERPQTLQEIGERVGCTRERVRQIEKDALAKLREYVQAA